MKVAIQGLIIETDNIYSVTNVGSINSGTSFMFLIESFNNKKLVVSLSANHIAEKEMNEDVNVVFHKFSADPDLMKEYAAKAETKVKEWHKHIVDLWNGGKANVIRMEL